MDKEVCLITIRDQLRDMHRRRRQLLKACEEGDFRTMRRIEAEMEYGVCVRLRNLIERDRYEDWGSVAMKEREEAP